VAHCWRTALGALLSIIVAVLWFRVYLTCARFKYPSSDSHDFRLMFAAIRKLSCTNAFMFSHAFMWHCCPHIARMPRFPNDKFLQIPRFSNCQIPDSQIPRFKSHLCFQIPRFQCPNSQIPRFPNS
jgi:hypothetical protein